MKNLIHQKVSIISYFLLLLLINGCTTTYHQSEIVSSSDQKWRIVKVRSSQSEEGWVVSGTLRSYNKFELPSGQVEITFVDSNGVVVQTHEVDYHSIAGNAGRRRNHQYGIAVFYFEVPEIPATVKIVARLKLAASV